jgi:alpha-aminoadipic semialdehyde synthase
MKLFQQLDLITSDEHPSLHSRGPEITWKQFLAGKLGQKEDILLSNLKNVLFERLGSWSRVTALEDLGLLSDEPVAKRGSPLNTVTEHLQRRLAFNKGERDLILMRHEIAISWPNGKEEQRNINLVVYGDSSPGGYSAMAKTVGYPTAIAGQMLLNGEIQQKGIVLPFAQEIYSPMLKRLRQENIFATETVTKLN